MGDHRIPTRSDASGEQGPRRSERLPFEKPYPGRGMIVGLLGASIVHVYWLTGRSENSRNRRLVHDGGVVRTAVADVSVAHDPTYTIYTAIQHVQGVTVVANGDHGDIVAKRAEGHLAPAEAWEGIEHEHDPPIWTPRIAAATGVSAAGEAVCWLATAYRAGDGSGASIWEPDPLEPGRGWGLQTYTGDETPAPYLDDPFAVEITTVDADAWWSRIDPAYRVALAVWIRDMSGDTHDVNIRNAR